MTSSHSVATTRRVLAQLRHDPRTIALLIGVPALLMVLVRYMFNEQQAFSNSAPALLGIFPFTLMFLVTSITTLRERSSGTLERLMTTPMAKLDLLLGYACAFGLVAIASVLVSVGVSIALGMELAGSLWLLLIVTAVDALLGVAIGLFASAFARTEFQAVQFMPVVVLPQLLLCGLFQPRDEMAIVLQWAANVLPVSYAVEALQIVKRSPDITSDYVRDLLVVVGYVIVSVVLAAATLRRRTP